MRKIESTAVADVDRDALHEMMAEMARVLGYPSADALPLNLSPQQTATVIDSTTGTMAVWRCTKRTGPPWVAIGGRIKYPTIGTAKYLLANTHTVAA